MHMDQVDDSELESKIIKKWKKELGNAFKNAHYSFVIQIKSRYDKTTHFYSEMQNVLQEFLQATLWQDSTRLQNIYYV